MLLGLAGAGVEPAPVADLIKMNEGTNMCANIESDRQILIRVSEAARLRGVCAMTVYKMIATGRLKKYYIPGCTIKVDRSR
jgi:excisionase family DNA binding protein